MTEQVNDAYVTVAYGAQTHVGNRRRVNEDSYYANFPIYLVADGMGGHKAGDVASAMVVKCMSQSVEVGNFVDTNGMTEALVYTAQQLSDLGMDQGNPGSTLTGLAFSTHRGIPCARIFNIGDSRTYLLSETEFSQITIDHSEFQELKDAGMLTPEEERNYKRKNILTKALGAGFSPSIPIDQFIIPVTAGDRYVICSDGISGEVTDSYIEMVARTIADPQEAAEELIRMALNAGGKDNATVVIVDVQEAFPQWESDAISDTTQTRIVVAEETDDNASEDTLPNEQMTFLRGMVGTPVAVDNLQGE